MRSHHKKHIPDPTSGMFVHVPRRRAPIIVYVTQEEHDFLKEEARKRGLTMSNLVRLAAGEKLRQDATRPVASEPAEEGGGADGR